MRLPVVSLLFLFSIFVSAQTTRKEYRDSLEHVLYNLERLEKEQRDSDVLNQKVELLCILARAFDGVDSTKTFAYGFQALELSKKNDYLIGVTDANFTIGRAYMYTNPQLAISYLKKGHDFASALIRKDSSKQIMKLWAIGSYNLGLTHGYLGNNQKEIDFTDSVIPLVEKLKDSLFLANIYTNLGVKYVNLANYKKAHYNLFKGRMIYKSLNDPPETTFNLTQLAMTFEQLDSLEQMKNTLDEAKILLSLNYNDFDKFNYNLQESQYFLRTQRPEAALKAVDEIYSLVKNDTKSVQYGMVMQHYALAHKEMKDFKKAVQFTTAYIENAKSMKRGNNWFEGLYKRSEYLAADKDFENAYKDLLLAVDLYDSLETINTVTSLEELNLKYASAQREKEILALKVRNEEKKSQSYLLGGLASVLSLILFIGFYAYGQKLRKSRKKERLREAEMQQLKQEQENEIFSAMIEGQEKERKRLAIDLHDGLGGRLSGISMNLSKIDKDEPKKYPKKQLQKILKDLDDSLTELRNVARNMMPETLVKFGLEAALKDYCSSMTGTETKVTLQFYGTDYGINLNQQVTMYRVIQELINNAIKHAQASEVLVQYMRENNHVDITVEDNGIGFDKDENLNKKDSGMGLSNLQTRVAYLKGNIDFESEKNEGTTVNVHINIDAV